jgi:hypothetical protein
MRAVRVTMLRWPGEFEESARRLEKGLDKPIHGLEAKPIESIGKTDVLFMRESEPGPSPFPFTQGGLHEV